MFAPSNEQNFYQYGKHLRKENRRQVRHSATHMTIYQTTSAEMSTSPHTTDLPILIWER